jgi:hypothetical protein
LVSVRIPAVGRKRVMRVVVLFVNVSQVLMGRFF